MTATMSPHTAVHLLSSPPDLTLMNLPSTLPPSSSPTDLSAELAHNKDLFSKLRFSYTEQVTKERFLKAVVADPPELVDPAELAALEAKLVYDKAGLKAKKGEVAAVLTALESRARELAGRWGEVEQREAGVKGVVEEMGGLEGRREELLAARPVRSENGLLNLGLEETRDETARRREEGEELAGRIEEVRRAMEGRRVDVERLRKEMEEVEGRKRQAVKEAMEMRRRRESGVDEGMDEDEAKGRWATAGVEVLRTLV